MRVWSTHRPISIGTYPREYGVIDIVNFSGRKMVHEINGYAFGYIDYERDLPKSEQDHYDLRPEITVNPKMEIAAREMAKALKRSDMSMIQRVIEKSYDMGLIDDEEELIRAAQRYM